MKQDHAIRRTKIVCTLGPATWSPGRIRALIGAGMDVARLNFSHGDRDSHRHTIRTLRAISHDLGQEVGILQDLGGPKIRLGEIPGGERVLKAGQRVVLTVDKTADGDALTVNYPYLADDVAQGDRILLADGHVELRVEAKAQGRLVCEVVVGDTVTSFKGVNLPGTALRVPSFTDKDRRDLAVGLEEGVDFVALSFVRHERDLDPVREILDQVAQPPMLIAKIEKPQALERLERILQAVDGVMVARGDLGVEMPVEQVPLIQKRVIRLARQAAKPVITATQMLRSMVESPRPLRAEATDVANAILDGSDALMLSEETSIGRYPVQATEMLDRIARSVEPHLQAAALLDEPTSELLPKTAGALSRAACQLAADTGAKAIVAPTTSGSTARLLSRLRPAAPIIGLTTGAAVQRQLALSWGVIPGLAALFDSTDAMFERALSWVVEQGFGEPGDPIIVTAGLPINVAGTTNLLRVMELPPQSGS